MKLVLVIDDDPIFAELAEAALSAPDSVAVLKASDGLEAMRYVDTCLDKLSLIVCDINMPNCDGVEMVGELGRRGVQTPIIFASAAAPSTVNAVAKLAKARDLNVVAMLTKPVNLTHLASLANTAMTAG